MRQLERKIAREIRREREGHTRLTNFKSIYHFAFARDDFELHKSGDSRKFASIINNLKHAKYN